MAPQWPAVVDRLVSLLPTLPGWESVTVFDGPVPTGQTPTDYVTVGYVSDDNAGVYNSTLYGEGSQYSEQGSIVSHLVCQTGNANIPAMRARVFALIGALEDEIRADRRLGVLSQEGYCDLTVDVQSISNARGSAQALNFTINYFTVA